MLFVCSGCGFRRTHARSSAHFDGKSWARCSARWCVQTEDLRRGGLVFGVRLVFDETNLALAADHDLVAVGIHANLVRIVRAQWSPAPQSTSSTSSRFTT